MNKQQKSSLGNNSKQLRKNHHLTQFINQFLSPSKKSEGFHGSSQPKSKSNIIKVNKTKLPADFFPKLQPFQKKISHFSHNLNEQDKYVAPAKARKVQSECLHISPQKTSFFGFFKNEDINVKQFQSPSKKMQLKRKLSTRQQQKKDNTQMKRRFTPGSHSNRTDLIQLFPSKYDQQMTQFVIQNLSARVDRLSPRKQSGNRNRQTPQVYDPQKSDEKLQSNIDEMGQDISSPKKKVINLKIIQKTLNQKNSLQYTFANCQTADLYNMTFFNIKSSCLPTKKA